MTISDYKIATFAETILFSPDLDRKLTAIEDMILDQSALPKITSVPDFPSRSPEIGFHGIRAQDKKIIFPGRSKLSDDRARGHVLHFFANHELLALELMALALLRWPDAPHKFRHGLVQIMGEEQNHMRLYLSRMRDFKVTFGEVPLNSFFWKCMKDLSSPMEFTAAMSMTFEQANLDFALQFEKMFADEGDIISSEIMRRVRLEEIGHVKHGYVWFERWRPKGARLFKEWQETLRFPITPARAKGAVFDHEGRDLAGLPSDYILELEVHNQSKGRPPKIFWFNPSCEQEVESIGGNWSPPKAITLLTEDYAALMIYLGHQSDIVLLKSELSVEFLHALAGAGFEIPELFPESRIRELKVRKFSSFEPWGWSPKSRQFFNPLRESLLTELTVGDQTPPLADQSIFSKNVAAKMRQNLNCDSVPSTIITNPRELEQSLESLSPHSPSSTVVLKSPFSSSGRGMLRIRNLAIASKDQTWIENVIRRHGSILAEPWLDKAIDLSTHIDIHSNGDIKFVGYTRFWTDNRGQYRGHIIGRLMDDLGPKVLERWHSESGWKQTLKDTALRCGAQAFAMGYSGPFGIDGMIYRQNDALHLRPLLEINPRWSMGRVAIALSQRIAAKHCGIWIHLSANDLKTTGHKSFIDLINHLDQLWPRKIATIGGAKLIHQGIIATNDPHTAKQFLSVLVVGDHLEQCYNAVTLGGIHDAQLELQSKLGSQFHKQNT